MAHISWLPNKLHTTGIQRNSIKVSSIGHRCGAVADPGSGYFFSALSL